MMLETPPEGLRSADGTSIRAVPIEQVLSVRPFVVRRRIAFRDCDPAGIVYTPRFFDPIATSALDLFMMEMIGPEGARDEGLEHLGTPAKAVEFVFHRGTPNGSLIDLTVACGSVRNTTFALTVRAETLDGTHLFDGRLTVICIDRANFSAIPVPQPLRERLSTYQIEEDTP